MLSESVLDDAVVVFGCFKAILLESFLYGSCVGGNLSRAMLWESVR